MKTESYGSWKSPITSDLITQGIVGLMQPQLGKRQWNSHSEGALSTDCSIYWLEMRPSEKARHVIIKADETHIELTPTPFNVRTRVHEYGGASYVIDNDIIYFSNFADQRVYKQLPGKPAEPITEESKDAALRYADFVVDSLRNRLICVREEHVEQMGSKGAEVKNTIVSIDLNEPKEGANKQTILLEGNDFYSTPILRPDGNQFAYLTWNHPNMPWDGTELRLATVSNDGSLGHTLIAGGVSESIFQPQWSPDGILYFISDRTNWWNLYRLKDGKIETVCEMDAEFGLPQWVFGMSTYAFADENRIVCTYSQNGCYKLGLIDVSLNGSSRLKTYELPFTYIDSVKASSGFALFLAGRPDEPSAIVKLDINNGSYEILKQVSNLKIDPGYISVPTPIEFPTSTYSVVDNEVSKQQSSDSYAHAFYYAPKNKDFSAPDGELPPLIVMSHGGPTAAATVTFKLSIQYWTSRGFAVLDVNYGGSTGYGRNYRDRLKSTWGITDVEDCVNGTKYLIDQGLVDGNRTAITGGSAGGYTTLCALTFENQFKAGASHYGISDLIALEEDGHKFESQYSTNLIAPYPEREDIYRERSPINHTDKLNAPVIFFQGLEDKIVPPNQAEKMVEALRKKKLPVAYIAFEGEQHGFRQAANIKRALDGEYYFYSRVFGFKPADEIEPVQIENL